MDKNVLANPGTVVLYNSDNLDASFAAFLMLYHDPSVKLIKLSQEYVFDAPDDQDIIIIGLVVPIKYHESFRTRAGHITIFTSSSIINDVPYNVIYREACVSRIVTDLILSVEGGACVRHVVSRFDVLCNSQLRRNDTADIMQLLFEGCDNAKYFDFMLSLSFNSLDILYMNAEQTNKRIMREKAAIYTHQYNT